MDNALWIEAISVALAVGLGVALARMLLALVGLVSSSGRLSRHSQHNKALALAHIFAISGYALIGYAQLLCAATKYQIPMDVAGGVCLIIGWTSVIVIDRRIRRTA